MLARGDLLGIQSLPAPSPPPFPGLGAGLPCAETDAEAAFLAGAALSRLDAIVRQNPPWAGVWRRRLALSAAAASVRRAGRTRRRGSPCATRSTSAGRAAIPDPRESSCLPGGSSPAARPGSGGPRWPPPPRFSGFLTTKRWKRPIEAAEACAASARPAPFAAARAFALARRALTSGAGRQSAGGRGGEGEAARGLARRRRARSAAELAVRAPPARRVIVPGRRTARRRPENPADGGETTRVVFAYARAAAGAVDLAGDLARRAEKLKEAAPKLRAKGAGAALRALLDEDCLAASSQIGGQISERGARRLFDRLVALGAIRELTGRATFRLYGL